MSKYLNKEKFRFNVSCCLILLIVLFLIISLINDRFSRAMSTAWDGTTIATGFAGGNGSSSSPYLISNGAELAFFKRVVEENNNVYNGFYYQLADDIDMGNHDFGTISKQFNGTFDGRGYSINNVRFTKSTINEVDYYGLFSYVGDGTISNITLNNVSINTVASTLDVVTGIVAGKVLPDNNATIKNISIINANLNITNTTENEDNLLGGVVGLIGYNTDFSNIHTRITINSNYSTSVGSLVSTINSNPGVTISKTNSINSDIIISTFANSNDVVEMENQFIIKDDNKIYLDEEEVDNTDDYKIITDLLSNNIGSYLWNYVSGNFVLVYSSIPESNDFTFESTEFTPTASSVDTASNVVTLNMLEEDYNYYKGLDYTEVRGADLPPADGYGYYGDNSLVAVKITYDGADKDDNRLIGAVSPINNENANKFVYYKYYPLERNSNGSLATDSNGNNYIKIELIDNPFSKRPIVSNVEYGFNGWVCNQNSDSSANICNNSRFEFDNDDYTRYLIVPVDGGSDIKIYLNASWHRANVITDNNANTNTINNGFNSMSMQPAVHNETTYTQMTGYIRWKNNYATFTQSGTIGYYGRIARYTYYKDDVDSDTYHYSGNNRPYCTNWDGCPTYTVNQNGIVRNSIYNGGSVEFVPNFVANNTNYSVIVNGYDSNYMNFEENQNGSTYNIPFTKIVSDLYDGTTAGGYFYQVTGTTAAMVNTREYYNSDGTLCTSANSCSTSYKLIRYNDSRTNSDGTSIYNINYAGDDPSTPENEGTVVDQNKYYYLVTRDQNIYRYTGNSLDPGMLQVNRPYTITGTSTTGTTVSGVINAGNSTITAANDLVIENIKFYGPSNDGQTNQDFGYSNTSTPLLLCNSKNVKIGRNITSSRNATNIALTTISAGTNNNTSTSGKIKIIVESGFYNAYRVTNSSSSSTFNLTSVLGSDYDKASGTNSKLKFMVGVIGMTTSNVTYNKGNDSPFLTFTYLRSGYFGYNSTGTPSTAADGSGIYVGGRGGSTRPGGPCGVKIEGGIVNMILGGSGKYGGHDDDNLIYVGMSSGSIRQVYAGATQSATRGNRIINITGGSVGGSVFGGSKSTSSSVGNGSINATALVYVGGTANIGTETSNVYDIAPGSVFGAGAGNANNSNLASVRNSHVIINGGTINGNVYGGGNYGAVGSQQAANVSTLVEVKSGNIKGDVYGGSNSNGFSQNGYRNGSHIDVNIYGGTIEGGVYGGSDTKGVCYGTVNVNIYNGTIGDVFGGGRGGYRNDNNPGTFVYGNVNVNIGSTTDANSSPKITNNVYGGSAFGTVNSDSQTANTSSYETNVTVNSGTVLKSVFGGGMGGSEGGFNYTPNVAGDATTTINGGNVGNVFGGNDAASYVKGDVEVYLKGGTIGNAYGGGNSTGQPTPYVYEQGATVNNIFGGSNVSGEVTNSNVTITTGNIGNVFGGNNAGGNTVTTLVTVNGGTFSGDIYGGGFSAESTTTNVNVNTVTVNDIYGGGQKAGATTTNVNTNGTTCDEVFGGSNISGDISTMANVTCTNTNGTAVYGAGNKANAKNTTVNMNTSTVETVYGGGNNASATTASIVNINSGTYTTVFGGGNAAGEHTSASATINYKNGTSENVFGGSNASGDITTTTVNVGTDTTAINNPTMNVYGGNNAGGKVQTTNVNLDKVTCNNVYGGGNEAIVGRTTVNSTENTTVNNLFGGGNAAGVTKISETSTIEPNTYVRINGSNIKQNVFGGGDEGIVSGSTEVYITDGIIEGNAYAGGNGSTAIVYTNSLITIDGNTVVGTSSSVAPSGGSVFGSGNAASTGDSGESSNSTVNIAGGHIYGNVYGGAKMSTVYGVATVNIGYNSISNNSSLNKENIVIDGSIYGGGESNESGSEIYDWNAYSVMKGIDVNIDGSGHSTFGVHGNIFGSGNASTSKGYSYIDIINVGSSTRPNRLLSIQRTDKCTIDSSYVEVVGEEDITNELNDYKFSFNRINELIIKNNTSLYVQNNANLVKAFTSGYDEGGTFIKNSVDIDENGNVSNLKTDNRLYTLSGINFNVNKDEFATEFGKVTGMTFFGMYKTNGSDYTYGLYDKSVQNGDTLSADAAISGGSYVQGLNYADYDYTEDGFYSNFFTDLDSSKPVYVSYIDPKKLGDNCNRWIIGNEVSLFKVTLYASPFGSAGTETLNMAEFIGSNVRYYVESFDSSLLNEGVSLLEKSSIPRIASTEEDANTNFALSLKTESQEWTNLNTTNMYSAGGGSLSGNKYYSTDTTNSVPRLNFYLYHSKNVTTVDEIGKCNLFMTVYVPINGIEDDVYNVKIEISLKGRESNSEAYASAINYGKKYDVFSMGSVNITSLSQFSTYYSLTLFDKQLNDIYGNNSYHALTTNKALPVGTMVTMIDFAQGTSPVTYYYEVDSTSYNNAVNELNTYGEINYKLTDFKKMSSTNGNYMYDEVAAHNNYYDSTTKLVDEEFIFIFDLSKTDGSFVVSDASMLMNLYQDIGGSISSVVNVYGNNAIQMIYNTYLNDNAILNETVSDYPTYVYHNTSNSVNLTTKVDYDKTEGTGVSIIDTNYNSSAMGLNVKLIDSSGNQVASNKLIGTYFVYNNENYFADAGGTFRIKLAGKVSDLSSRVLMVTDDTLDEGEYTVEYTLFASEDGLHNSDDRSVTESYTITVISSQSNIVVDCDDKAKLIIGETGLNANGDNSNQYSVKVNSQLSNLQVNVEVQKRSIQTIDTVEYNKVSFDTLFTNNYVIDSNNEAVLGITTNGTHNVVFNINDVDDLTSGTYRLVFKLYDNNVLIDSEYKYVIVDKEVVE